MPSQMWFRDDLQNILLALNAASAAAARLSDPALAPDPGLAAAYRQGFEEAVESVAVALGIAPTAVGLRLEQPRHDAPEALLACADRRPA